MSDDALARETIAPDEARVTTEIVAFLRAASVKRYPTGVPRRFNQGRAAGCVVAEFSVLEDVPAECRVGLFAVPRTYRARIRFASAASTSDREKDSRGMSIKVEDVGGENVTPGETTQDFILISHPVMMVDGPQQFLALLRAVEAGGIRRALYFLTHPGAARIAMASRQHHASHVDIPYWSTTPYLLGTTRAVKYAVRPTSPAASLRTDPPTEGYLHDALRTRLERGAVSFDFMIQRQTDARATPIEDASIEWKERDSPYLTVGRIHIPPQRVPDPDGDAACEDISFNPWHTRVEHRPIGGFNRARRDIYTAMAAFRHERAPR